MYFQNGFVNDITMEISITIRGCNNFYRLLESACVFMEMVEWYNYRCSNRRNARDSMEGAVTAGETEGKACVPELKRVTGRALEWMVLNFWLNQIANGLYWVGLN